MKPLGSRVPGFGSGWNRWNFRDVLDHRKLRGPPCSSVGRDPAAPAAGAATADLLRAAGEGRGSEAAHRSCEGIAGLGEMGMGIAAGVAGAGG